MEKPPIKFQKTIYSFFIIFLVTSCANQSSITARYLTAEKLWTEKKYEASVIEFDKVVKENPNSAMGLQALWRASTTRSLFLKEYSEALRGLQSFVDQSAQQNLIKEAQKEIGEILFSKLNQYEKAIEHYQKLIDSGKFSQEEGFFLYRISRAYVSSGKIRKAISIQEKILSKYKDDELIIKTKLDLAQNWYTIGEIDKQAYLKSLQYYQQVSNDVKTRNRKKYNEAQFGLAMVLEEMDRSDEALKIYQAIEKEFDIPNVIKIRIQKIYERSKRKKI